MIYNFNEMFNRGFVCQHTSWDLFCDAMMIFYQDNSKKCSILAINERSARMLATYFDNIDWYYIYGPINGVDVFVASRSITIIKKRL